MSAYSKCKNHTFFGKYCKSHMGVSGADNCTAQVEDTTCIIKRASSGCNPASTGIRIIESVLRANRQIHGDLDVRCTTNKMRENGVLLDI